LAALDASHRLGRIDAAARNRLAAPATRARLAGLRGFLDALYRPRAEVLAPRDPEVVVCRCEEVTVAELRAAVALGCQGPNQAKAFTRCGMGPCQGRLCGLTVAAVIAEARAFAGRGRPPQGPPAARPDHPR
jgi:NADPH-dependent 2,4-dienoyl-CoA reductase/sulfur reductase-like enzyme